MAEPKPSLSTPEAKVFLNRWAISGSDIQRDRFHIHISFLNEYTKAVPPFEPGQALDHPLEAGRRRRRRWNIAPLGCPHADYRYVVRFAWLTIPMNPDRSFGRCGRHA